MPASYTITGAIENDRIVRLEKPASLPASRVRVPLEPRTRPSSQDRNGENLFVQPEQTDEHRSKPGAKPLTKEEIDALVAGLQEAANQ